MHCGAELIFQHNRRQQWNKANATAVNGCASQYQSCLRRTAGLQRPNLSVQSALVARRFVFMHKALSGHAVEHRHSRRVGFRRRSFITGSDRGHYPLDMGAHHGTHTRIAGASRFGLTSAFFGLGRIRQDSLLEKLGNPAEQYRPWSRHCQPLRHRPGCEADTPRHPIQPAAYQGATQ